MNHLVLDLPYGISLELFFDDRVASARPVGCGATSLSAQWR
jgi:hypothetical protein